MYSVIKNVIEQGGFDLPDLLEKIDTLWVKGKLSDEQQEELIAAARNGANTQASVDVQAKLAELDRRIKALESSGTAAPSEDYSEFVVGKWYYKGDTCTFDGKRYACVAPEGTPCVWSPSEYPAYWELVA